MSEKSSNQPAPKDDEIDLVEIARHLWTGRKTILVITALFVVLGGFYILYKKLTIIPEYESHVTLYIDSPSPEVLPTLISSAPFMAEVLKIRLIHPGTHQSETVMEILNKHTRPPQGNVAALMSRVKVKLDDTRTLQLSIVMQNSLQATQLADSIGQKLAPFLLAYQIQWTQKNLQYLAGQYREAEAAYRQSLQDLSNFYDQNARNLHARDTITIKRLQADKDIKYDIYSELALQLERVRIKEQEQIPIYNILEPATVAKQNNAQKTIKTLFIMLFLGLFAGVGLLYVKSIFHNFKTTDR
jgi:uncharacterized protein involved in exopolysaccharide biosynthesis